jgi:hypothetical protein
MKCLIVAATVMSLLSGAAIAERVPDQSLEEEIVPRLDDGTLYAQPFAVRVLREHVHAEIASFGYQKVANCYVLAKIVRANPEDQWNVMETCLVTMPQ